MEIFVSSRKSYVGLVVPCYLFFFYVLMSVNYLVYQSPAEDIWYSLKNLCMEKSVELRNSTDPGNVFGMTERTFFFMKSMSAVV